MLPLFLAVLINLCYPAGMALSKTVKIVLALAGGGVIVGGIAYAVSASSPPTRKPKRAIRTKDVEPFDPGDIPIMSFQVGMEPNPPTLSLQDGHWLTRWQDLEESAMREVRLNSDDISGFEEYWKTVVAHVFPEVSGLSANQWPSWLSGEASDHIKASVHERILSEGVPTVAGWEFMLWLRFDSVIDGCYEALAPHSEAIAQCVASEIYPSVDWPADGTSPLWEQEMWASTLAKVDAYVGSQS